MKKLRLFCDFGVLFGAWMVASAAFESDIAGACAAVAIGAYGLWCYRDGRRAGWMAERQLEHLRMLLQQDHRYLAHDRTADALTNRYLSAAANDWNTRWHESAGNFRDRIGLNPLPPVGSSYDDSMEPVEGTGGPASG